MRLPHQGPCESAETVATTETTPYFTAETQEMALISGGDSAYLTDPSKITEVDATGTYSNAEANMDAGSGTFAYVIGQATASADGRRHRNLWYSLLHGADRQRLFFHEYIPRK
jgi:ketosteroid isomerase-like protein